MPTILDEQFDQEEDLRLVAKKKPTKMKPPNNERQVLTRIRDTDGNEFWQLDSYTRLIASDHAFWYEASAWDCEVLYWQELPPKPDYEGME